MTKPKIYFIIPSFGALAQLGARLHGMEEVTGSNPVCSTHEKAGKSDGNGFFPCFFHAFQPSFLPLLAQHMPHLSQKSCHGSRHKISEASPGFPRSIFFRRSLSRHLSPRRISQMPLSPDRAAHRAESLSQSNRSPSKYFSHPP